jgi:hypothetical protein
MSDVYSFIKDYSEESFVLNKLELYKNSEYSSKTYISKQKKLDLFDESSELAPFLNIESGELKSQYELMK